MQNGIKKNYNENDNGYSYNSNSNDNSDYNDKNIQYNNTSGKISVGQIAGIAATLIVGICVIGLILFWGNKNKTSQEDKQTTTEQTTEKAAEQTTEIITEQVKDEKIIEPVIYEIKEGVFIINSQLFNKSYDEIESLVASQGFEFALDEPTQWFSDIDCVANWINPSGNASVGFFFIDNKLIAIEYNDKVSLIIEDGFAQNVTNTVSNIYLYDDKIIKYSEDSGEIEGIAYFIESMDGSLYGIYTACIHRYTDSDGNENHEIKQIYNMSNYYMYQAEIDTWSDYN